jgi:tetratricopeptide (TPR) repeat protein
MAEHLTDTDKLQFIRKAKLLEKKARELAEVGDYERSGLLYGWTGYACIQLQVWEDAGYNYGQSGEAYKRIGNWSKAGFSYNLSGEAYEKTERWLGAGLNYTQSGYAYEQSKEYEKAGESYRRAGESYRETGKWQEVAISYQQSGEACQTAKAWRSAGLSFAQSGDAYKKALMWTEAEENYCKAKMAYTEAGAYEDAGSMYYKEMRMKRMCMKKWSLKRFTSYLYDLICGYGEKPRNIIFCWVVIILFFTIIYLFPSGLIYHGNAEISDGFLAKAFYSLYFSVITFATFGQNEFEPTDYMRPFVMLEAIIGISMITMFILVLGKKMMKR